MAQLSGKLLNFASGQKNTHQTLDADMIKRREKKLDIIDPRSKRLSQARLLNKSTADCLNKGIRF
jgi:hypothetical protein